MYKFFGNIKQEWNKMTWPTSKDMRIHSTQVFVFMLVLILFFAVVDGAISVAIVAPNRPDDAYELESDYEDNDLDELLDNDDADGDEDQDEDGE